MKKKTAVLFVLLAVCMAVGLAACGFFGAVGPDESTPYTVAVSEGYAKSEGEWLAENTTSSVYRQMWKEAVDDGSFTGTYFEFLKQLGLGDSSAFLQRSLLSAVSVVAYSTRTSASAGSGVILSIDKNTGDMDVLTNYHIVYSSSLHDICDEITVSLYGGETSTGRLKATYTGGSAEDDLALLHINGSDTVIVSTERYKNADVVKQSAAIAAEIGSSEALTLGERVYAVGNPEATGISVVDGVVSVDAEYVTMQAIVGSGTVNMLEIRTDVAVNHGNSGGGLFNAAGQLVGIVNARSEASGVEGFGYAIPIDHAMAVVSTFQANGGVVKRARIGITAQTAESHSVFDAASGRTFVSEKVTVYSAEERAVNFGLDVGDTFISMTLNGRTIQVTRRYFIADFLFSVRKGDVLTIVVSRNDELLTLNLHFDRDEYFE